MSVILTVAPTGPIAFKADNPHLPTSPNEIAGAVAEAYGAGAAVAHIHLRDAQQRPTADLQIARRNVRAGLEDTLQLRRGELSPGNLPLVQRAARLARDLDLDLASVAEAEQQLGLTRA